MIIVCREQRTDEWRAARVGLLTGSCVADVFATIKKGEAAARRDLRLRLVVERLTGRSQEDRYVSRDMQRGVDLEPAARAAYEAATGSIVRPVGFVRHDELPAGCSPDGEVKGFAGIVEFKCPKTATHLGYLRTGKVPDDYLPQITHNLWITGAEWCDFASFDDCLDGPGRLFRVRVQRGDVDIPAHELAVRLFLGEVEKELAEVRALVGKAA